MSSSFHDSDGLEARKNSYITMHLAPSYDFQRQFKGKIVGTIEFSKVLKSYSHIGVSRRPNV